MRDMEFEEFKDVRLPAKLTGSNLEINHRFWKDGKVNILFPMLCLLNHYHPQKLDYVDAIYFTLNKYNNNIVTIRLTSDFTILGQEVSYTYNTMMLEPYLLLMHYGFVVENNIFGNLGLTLSKVSESLTDS
jgi:hypothetical protein